MATYRIYLNRNAWRANESRDCVAFQGDLAGAKARADSLGWNHIESETGATLHYSHGAWRRA